jgi:hypothetical protein
MTGATGHGRTFARDKPLSSLYERDYLGHRAYTDALVRALLNAEPPFAIALNGEWGVGKTTIAGDQLRQALHGGSGGQPIGFVYFDVWKYEGDSLRRQILREVAGQLQQAGLLSSRYTPRRELEDLSIETSEAHFTGLGSLKWPLVVTAVRAGLIAGLTFLVLNVAASLKAVETLLGSTQNRLGTSLLVALFGSALAGIPDVVSTRERRITQRPVAAAEQFEAKFQRLMDAAMVKRLVVVLDNLDRCEPAIVVDALATVKTFLEPDTAVKPLFVVPCDLEAVRRHLLSARSSTSDSDDYAARSADADEYLRKFFNAVIRVNPFLDVDLQQLVERELEEISLSGELAVGSNERAAVVQVIMAAFRRNPRRIKQFLNNLVLKRMLLQERERLGHVNPPISNEVAFLAKITVIEEAWPKAFERIQADPRAMDLLEMVAGGGDTDAPGDLVSLVESDLRRFLRATATITSQRPAVAFARLKLDPYELSLPNYYAFRDALISGDADELRTYLPSDAEALDRYQQVVCRTLRDQVAFGYTAALAVMANGSQLQMLYSETLANDFAEVLDGNETILNQLPLIDPIEVVKVTVGATNAARRRVVVKLARLAWRTDLSQRFGEDRVKWWLERLAQAFVGVFADLSPDDRDAIREMSRYVMQSAAVAVLNVLAAEDSIAKALIEPDGLSRLFRGVSESDFGTDNEGRPAYSGVALLWWQCCDIAPEDAVDQFRGGVAQLLQQPLDDAVVADHMLALLCATIGPLARYQNASSENLTRVVAAQYDRLSPGDRWMIAVVVTGLQVDILANTLANIGERLRSETSEVIDQTRATLMKFGEKGNFDARHTASMVLSLLPVTDPVWRSVQLMLDWAAATAGGHRHRLWADAVRAATSHGIDSPLVSRVRDELERFADSTEDQEAAVELLSLLDPTRTAD